MEVVSVESGIVIPILHDLSVHHVIFWLLFCCITTLLQTRKLDLLSSNCSVCQKLIRQWVIFISATWLWSSHPPLSITKNLVQSNLLVLSLIDINKKGDCSVALFTICSKWSIILNWIQIQAMQSHLHHQYFPILPPLSQHGSLVINGIEC